MSTNTLIYNHGNEVGSDVCRAGYAPVYVKANRADGFAFLQCKSAYANEPILGIRTAGSSQTLTTEVNNVSSSYGNICVYCPNGAVVYCTTGSSDYIIPGTNTTWDGSNITIYDARYYANPLLFTNFRPLRLSSSGLMGGFNGVNTYTLSQYEAYHNLRSGFGMLNCGLRWLQNNTWVNLYGSSYLRLTLYGYTNKPKTEKNYIINGLNGLVDIYLESFSRNYNILFRNCVLSGEPRVKFASNSATFYLLSPTILNDEESMNFYMSLLNAINEDVTKTATVNLYIDASIESQIRAIAEQAPSNLTYKIRVE